jgi:serine/threonine protein kinase
VIGTLSYMAPEQLQGKARPASDQYALAVVVYEWISGRKPFTGSYMEIVAQHLSTPPPLLDEQALAIPHTVQQVLRHALAKDPHQRFPSVQNFAEELERAFQAHTVNGANPQRAEQAPRGRGQAYNGQGQHAPVLPPTQLVVGQPPPVAPHGRGQAHAPLAVAPSPPVKTSGRMIKKGLKWGLGTLAVIVLLGGLLLCGLGFAAYQFFLSPSTPKATNSAGAAALANDFVHDIASQNYDRAYNDLAPSLTSQTSRTQFTQQAQSEDRCDGVVTAAMRTDTTTQGNALIYNYTMTRARLQQPYQLHLTLQQANSGNWQIINYGSNVSSVSQCA